MSAMLDTLLALTDGLPPGTTILCAVSGGADSVCLLHQLTLLRLERPFTLLAAHYNHHLRGQESDRDEAFVRDFVRRYCGEIPPDRDGSGVRVLPPVQLIVGSGDVAAEARRRKLGVEETAREMRYDFLRETARRTGADFIATAHNADDNAETLLLHLLRGTGLRGLGGIPPRRDNLIRPLLHTTRAEIQDYLRIHQLPHVEDSTNQTDDCLRNRVRHQVMPLLEQLAPGFTRRSVPALARLRADEDLLTAQARELTALARPEGAALRLPASCIAQAPDPLAVRAVRCLIAQLNGGDQDCAAVHLKSVTALCRSGAPSGQVHLPYGLLARREYGDLVLTPEQASPCCPRLPLPLPGELQAGMFHIAVHKEPYLAQPQTPWDFWLSGTLVGLSVRPRETGDVLKRPGHPSRTVKKLMIDLKIPRHLRDALPVFCQGATAVAAAGLGPDTGFLPGSGEISWHVTIRSDSPAPESKNAERKNDP